MAEDRDDGLTGADEALRTLRAELAVAPSEDLQARVRARIAGRRVRAPRWTWALPLAAATLLAIAALVATRARRGAVADVPPAAPPAVASPAPTPEPRAVERKPATVPSPRHRAAPPPRVPVRPLVPEGEETRIALYVGSVRRLPFAEDSLPDRDPRDALAEPPAIAVPPLETTPLVLDDEGSPR